MTATLGRPSARASVRREYMPRTIQKKQLQTLLTPEEAVVIEGYVQDRDGVLKTAKQAVEELLISGETMHNIESIDEWIYFAYDDGTDSYIKRYDGSTTETIKTYSSDISTITLHAFDKYLFAANDSKIGVHHVDYQLAQFSSYTGSGFFTMGQSVTGQTSGNNIIPRQYFLSGATGIFTYSVGTGELSSGETFDDGSGKSAQYDGSVDFYEISGSPDNVSIFTFYEAYEGGAEFLAALSDGRAMWSKANDDITKIPFMDWTQTDPPTPASAYERVYKKGGTHQTLTAVGSDLFLGALKASILFRIQNLVVGSATQQDNVTTHQSGVGATCSFAVDNMLFYVSGKEWWKAEVLEGGLQIDRKPLTQVIDNDRKEDFTFDDAFHFYDRDNSIVYLVFRNKSAKNNYMLGYDMYSGDIKEHPHTYLNDVIEHDGQLWGVGSLTTNLVRVFGGYENNGKKVRTRFLSKKVTNDKPRRTLHIDHLNIDGKLDGLIEVVINLYTWDKNGKALEAHTVTWCENSSSEFAVQSSGVGDLEFVPGDDLENGNIAWNHLHLKNVSAYQFEAKTIGYSPHELRSVAVTTRDGDLQIRGTNISLPC